MGHERVGLTFGGLLLLGGRAGDILGRRRMFMVGLGAFALFSLSCGLSTQLGMLIAFRALPPGLAGAILSPSVFSIVTVTFEEGKERNTALGILGGSPVRARRSACSWAASSPSSRAGSGSSSSTCRSACGAVLRAALRPREPLGRDAAPLRRRRRGRGHREPHGARLRAHPVDEVAGARPRRSALLLASAVLMAAFLVIESRVAHAAASPLGFFRRRTPTGANIVGFGLGTGCFGMFFCSRSTCRTCSASRPLQTGVAYLAVCAHGDRRLRRLAGARDQARRQADPLDRHDRLPVGLLLFAQISPTARTSRISSPASS